MDPLPDPSVLSPTLVFVRGLHPDLPRRLVRSICALDAVLPLDVIAEVLGVDEAEAEHLDKEIARLSDEEPCACAFLLGGGADLGEALDLVRALSQELDTVAAKRTIYAATRGRNDTLQHLHLMLTREGRDVLFPGTQRYEELKERVSGLCDYLGPLAEMHGCVRSRLRIWQSKEDAKAAYPGMVIDETSLPGLSSGKVLPPRGEA